MSFFFPTLIYMHSGDTDDSRHYNSLLCQTDTSTIYQRTVCIYNRY